MRLLIAALAALALAGCSSSGTKPATSKPAPVTPTSTRPSKPPKVTAFGTMSIGADGYAGNGFKDGSHCYGDQGYDDIVAGTEVTISDDAGRTLGITQLHAGHISEYECVFKFRAKVPAGKRFYGVEVSHRGVVKISERELGEIALTLG